MSRFSRVGTFTFLALLGLSPVGCGSESPPTSGAQPAKEVPREEAKLRALLVGYLTSKGDPDPAVQTELESLSLSGDPKSRRPNGPSFAALLSRVNDSDESVRGAACVFVASVLPKLAAEDRLKWVGAFCEARERSPYMDLAPRGFKVLYIIADEEVSRLERQLGLVAFLSQRENVEFNRLFAAYGEPGRLALDQRGYGLFSPKELEVRAKRARLAELEAREPLSEVLRMNREFQMEYRRTNQSRIAPQMPPTAAELEKPGLRQDVLLGQMIAPLLEDVNPTPGRAQARAARAGRNRQLLARAWPHASPPDTWKADDPALLENDPAVLRLANAAAAQLLATGRYAEAAILAVDVTTMSVQCEPPASMPDVVLSLVLLLDVDSRSPGRAPDFRQVDAAVQRYSRPYRMTPSDLEAQSAALVIHAGAARIHLRHSGYERSLQYARDALAILTTARMQNSPVAGEFYHLIATAQLGLKQAGPAVQSAEMAVRLFEKSLGWEWAHTDALGTLADARAAMHGPAMAANRLATDLEALSNGPDRDTRRLVLSGKLGRLRLDAGEAEAAAAVLIPAANEAKSKLGDQPVTANLWCLRAEAELARNRIAEARAALAESKRIAISLPGANLAIANRVEELLKKNGK